MKFSACMTPAYCRGKAPQFLGINTNTRKVVSLPQNWLGCRGVEEKKIITPAENHTKIIHLMITSLTELFLLRCKTGISYRKIYDIKNT
jgi:hypothetical protein